MAMHYVGILIVLPCQRDVLLRHFSKIMLCKKVYVNPVPIIQNCVQYFIQNFPIHLPIFSEKIPDSTTY